MTLVYYKAIAAVLVFITSVATALYPLKKRTTHDHAESIELGEALASGIFLGAAFFHMLPDAINMFSHLYGSLTYPVPEAICVGAFLFLLFLERLSLTSELIRSKNSIPYLLTGILIIHALIEGAALGIGATFSEAFMIFIAVIAHKGSESFALCMTMLRHQLPFRRILLIIILFSLMTPAGIWLGALINLHTFARNGALAAACFNAFAAGTFLYISTLHHVHFHKHAQDARGMLEFGSLVAGLVAMGVIALWV